jgi:hypothetical protein
MRNRMQNPIIKVKFYIFTYIEIRVFFCILCMILIKVSYVYMYMLMVLNMWLYVSICAYECLKDLSFSFICYLLMSSVLFNIHL